MEKWFKFIAWNSQSLCGFGTQDEAETYAGLLNLRREINTYSAWEITDENEILDLDSVRNHAGFRLGPAIDAARENNEFGDRWQNY